MDKISKANMAAVMKTASASLRALSQENAELKQKVAHYERKEMAEKIASRMQDKNLNPDLSYQEKVAHLMEREDINVVSEAVEMSAPQMKLASVYEGRGDVIGGDDGNLADQNYLATLASM